MFYTLMILKSKHINKIWTEVEERGRKRKCKANLFIFITMGELILSKIETCVCQKQKITLTTDLYCFQQ